MLRIAFGNNPYEGEVVLDLDQEDIHFVLLVGRVGAGKSFFHRHVYHDLVTSHLPATLKFLFLDVPGTDAREWQRSPYLLEPVQTDPELGLQTLERLADESEEHTFAGAGGTQSIIVHIEEDALVRHDRQRLERCFESLRAHRRTNQIYVFYSTSVVDRRYLDDWLKRFVDLRIIFPLTNRRDINYLAGGPLGLSEPGMHALLWQNKKVICLPFLKESSV